MAIVLSHTAVGPDRISLVWDRKNTFEVVTGFVQADDVCDEERVPFTRGADALDAYLAEIRARIGELPD